MTLLAPSHRRLLPRRLALGGSVFCTFPAARALPVLADGGARGPAPLIVLDPGHGGRDPGAMGPGGTMEKDVTLASGLAVKSALEARGRFRVALTRAEDQFVPREERAAMARRLGASLFLSLHADRIADPAIRGASVYTLAKHASDAETAALAERENGVAPRRGPPADLVAPDVVAILASLANRETRAVSARLAHRLVRDMERDLPVLPTPERHADFTVLHAAGIPGVLIEMGFLSNRADEAALNDTAHRARIAGSVTRTVEAWFFATYNQNPGRAPG